MVTSMGVRVISFLARKSRREIGCSRQNERDRMDRRNPFVAWARFMSQVIVCSGCGQGLRVPTGHDGPYIECPACGEICDVPRQAPAGAFKATPSSRAPVAKAAANDDEDDSPYEIPPDPNEKTP